MEGQCDEEANTCALANFNTHTHTHTHTHTDIHNISTEQKYFYIALNLFLHKTFL